MTISSQAAVIPVTTYTGQGCSDVNELVRQMVNDLIGTGDPVIGNAAPHMQLVYSSETIDFTMAGSMLPDKDYTVVLESTTNMDPFARSGAEITGDVANAAKDPWRICFQTYNWGPYETYVTATPPPGTFTAFDPAKDNLVRSLGVYVGTPSTLNVTGGVSGTLSIAYHQTDQQIAPAWWIHANKGAPLSLGADYLALKKYDFVEPIGNLGQEWSHHWEPSTKLDVKGAPASKASSFQAVTPTNGADAKTIQGDGPDVLDQGQLFVNRYRYQAKADGLFGQSAGNTIAADKASPMSYRTVLTDHGLFLSVWGENPEELASGFSWVLVQRSVDKKTGIVRGVLPGFPNGDPLHPGNRPLFCVNSTGNNYYKFVVREHDLPVPSLRKDAAGNDEDSGAIINAFQQQSLTENGEYVITFLNNLNSSRFKYADELDMVGTVSADVVGGGSDIEVNVYNEQNTTGTPFPSKRRYHALWPSGQFGTKMRVMVVADTPFVNQDV